MLEAELGSKDELIQSLEKKIPNEKTVMKLVNIARQYAVDKVQSITAPTKPVLIDFASDRL